MSKNINELVISSSEALLGKVFVLEAAREKRLS